MDSQIDELLKPVLIAESETKYAYPVVCMAKGLNCKVMCGPSNDGPHITLQSRPFIISIYKLKQFFSPYLKSSPARVSSRSRLISGATGALLRDCLDRTNETAKKLPPPEILKKRPPFLSHPLHWMGTKNKEHSLAETLRYLVFSACPSLFFPRFLHILRCFYSVCFVQFFSRYLKSSSARVSSRSCLISGATGALLRDCLHITNGLPADL
ncbi:hypothetical protein CEXT_488181 [Caerostris extrusa]|uniref:Uncharacterized protein n=1 Tax=Caerostris extrusa TaxID=172846 RepID=A0AAV4XLS0_CAEEX|nr:hypothetical protein CEXT_488181 [Caerostris extrusa]